MKTKLKFQLLDKGLHYLFILLLVVCSSCGGDDEPDYDDSNLPELTTGISPSIFPGTWIIESVKQIYTDKVIPINKEFTVLPFQVTQTSPNDVTKYSDGSEEWGEPYFNLISVPTINGTSYGEAGMSYFKRKGTNLSNSTVTIIMLNFPDYNENGRYGLLLSDMEFSDGVLIAKNGGFNYEETSFNDNDFAYIGEVRLRKK